MQSANTHNLAILIEVMAMLQEQDISLKKSERSIQNEAKLALNNCEKAFIQIICALEIHMEL